LLAIESGQAWCHNRIYGLGPVGPEGLAALSPGGIEDEMTIAYVSAVAAIAAVGVLWLLGTNIRVVKQYERGSCTASDGCSPACANRDWRC
jgi:hypothetical protein